MPTPKSRYYLSRLQNLGKYIKQNAIEKTKSGKENKVSINSIHNMRSNQSLGTSKKGQEDSFSYWECSMDIEQFHNLF